METNKDNVYALSKQNQEETTVFFSKLKKKKPKQLDDLVHDIHHKIVDQFDCMSCGNCCKSISPMLTIKDIERVAKHLRMKEVDFINQYLHIDEDNCYVFNLTPCPFFMSDNACMIYDHRPKACREYPHTDRRRFYQVLDLTSLNREICPIVYDIVELLKKEKL